MWRKLIETTNDRVATLLRLALGIVILPHGLQKAFGWFGGYGITGTIQGMNKFYSIPAALVLLVIAAEFLGGLGLLAGLASRAAAGGLAAVLAGAVALGHWRSGFFMNWSGQQAGEGFEYHILAIAIALAVMVRGSGAFSLDRLLLRRAVEPAAVAGRARALASRTAA
jgi:putative oxidoreductase